MAKLKCLVVMGALIVLANAENAPIPPETHNGSTTTTQQTTSVVSTTVPTTTPHTTPPTTTPTHTTTAPTTTHPTTTTVKPDTTTVPSTTTTVSPKTTTHAPTTTPAPSKPVPEPKVGTWTVNYTDSSNISCIIATMSLQIEALYLTTDNKTNKGYMDMPMNASSSGYCGEENQNITLKWINNTITFIFTNTSKTYALDKIEINIVPDANFTNAMSQDAIHLVHVIKEFNTTSKKSYKCAKLQSLNLTHPNSLELAGNVFVKHLQLQAFNNGTTFADAVDCEPFDTPDIIPIAAGIALGVLIAFVLIGYLVGRRRSQARGYLSMFTQTKREEDYIPMKNLSCFN